MSRLLIIGAGGHGKVIADIAAQRGYTDIAFLDDNRRDVQAGYPVVGAVADAGRLEGDLFVAIGNGEIRRRIQESLPKERLATLIHPRATVARDAKIGAGSVVMAGAVVNPGASIGDGVIVNTASSVDHDCAVGDFAHIAVGAHLCGTVEIGADTMIGAGAVVTNNRRVCAGCLIGAGAAVVKDLDQPGTYVGVPARRLP
ncbi:MAG: acetyltransferase [Acutalibacteraceae bacterium]|jgi:sugar O-acyltransferase (sialic acid O-acetyltransferase NeuD family)